MRFVTPHSKHLNILNIKVNMQHFVLRYKYDLLTSLWTSSYKKPFLFFIHWKILHSMKKKTYFQLFLLSRSHFTDFYFFKCNISPSTIQFSITYRFVQATYREREKSKKLNLVYIHARWSYIHIHMSMGKICSYCDNEKGL